MSLKEINTHLLSSTAQCSPNVDATHAVNFFGYRADLFILRSVPTAFAEIDFITNGAILHFSAGVIDIKDVKGATELLPMIFNAIPQAPEFSDRATVVVHDAFRFRITEGCNREDLADSLKISFDGCPDILSQAYAMGSAINRLPYSQYLEGYAKDGHFKVVFHGHAQCFNGILQFYPDGRVIRTTPRGNDKWRIQMPGEEEGQVTLSADDLEFSEQQAGRRRDIRKARGPEQ